MNFNNHILIALPNMADARFKQAVILICEHNKNGTMGLVLNQPMNLSTEHIFADLKLNKPMVNHAVLDGGPINKTCGFVIHNNNQSFKSTLNIQNNLSLTTSHDLLERIANHDFVDKWQFILGYSSWVEGQLENELASNTWLTCAVDLDLIFNTAIEQRWQKALALIGIDNYQNITEAGHA